MSETKFHRGFLRIMAWALIISSLLTHEDTTVHAIHKAATLTIGVILVALLWLIPAQVEDR